MDSDCRDIRRDIEFYVLGALDPESHRQVKAHLLGCAQCQDLERQYRLLLCELEQQWSDPVHTQRLTARVCATSRPYLQTLGERKRRRYSRVAMQSIAALLMVGLAVWWLWPHPANPAEPRKTVWHKTDTLGTEDDIAADSGVVFFLQQQDGRALVNAAQADSGTWLWQSALPSLGYLETDKQRVYCVVNAGPNRIALAALDQETGQTLWTFGPQRCVHTPGQSLRPTVVSDHRLCWIVGNRVYGIDPQTGMLQWQQRLAQERRLSRAVVMRRQRVCVAGRRHIYCLEGHQGNVRWRLACSAAGQSGPYPLLAAGRRRLFVATSLPDGRSCIQCINARTRECEWTKTVAQTTQLHADAKRVYLRSQGVTALDLRSGRQCWQVMAKGCGPLTVHDDLLCFVDQAREGHLVALQRGNGKLAWHIPGLHSGQAFVKTENRGFLRTLDSTVLAFAFEH